MREKQLHLWRHAVANGMTTQSFEDWLTDHAGVPRYICAIGEVTVYTFIDLDEGCVVRVIADDQTLQPTDEHNFRYADAYLGIFGPGIPSGLEAGNAPDVFGASPSDQEIGEAMTIMDGSDWPAWEFSW